MHTEKAHLRRGFRGYRRKDVEEALSAHQHALRQVEQTADAAKATVTKLQADIEEVRQDVQTRDHQIQDLQEQVRRLTSEGEQQRAQADGYRQQAERFRVEAEQLRQELEAARAPDRIAEMLNEELSRILATAQESAERVAARADEAARQRVAEAEGSAKQRVAEAEGVWEDIQAEMARFTAWWRQIEPLIRAVQARIQHATSRADEVAERIREALSPTLQAIIDVHSDLSRLEEAAAPPALKAPTEGRTAQGGEPAAAPGDNGQGSRVVRIEEPVPTEPGGDGEHHTEFSPWG